MPHEFYNTKQLPPPEWDAVEDLTDHPMTVFVDGTIVLIGFRSAEEYMEALREASPKPPPTTVDGSIPHPGHYGTGTRSRVHWEGQEEDDFYERYFNTQNINLDTFFEQHGPSARQPATCPYCGSPGRKRRVCNGCGRVIP